MLARPPDKPLLEGIAILHFGAFFKRGWRENDYLWGRLDGSARLLRMLLGDDDKGLRERAFAAIVSAEEKDLTAVDPAVFTWVKAKAAGSPAASRRLRRPLCSDP